jgi:galactokinase
MINFLNNDKTSSSPSGRLGGVGAGGGVYFSPGRVNLIGEHLDYNGGNVMPFAIDMGIKATVSQNREQKIKLSSATHENQFEFDINTLPNFSHENHWANYPIGILKRLQHDGIQIPSLTITFESNLPEGSGLSSSAAIEVLTAFIILNQLKLNIDRKHIALLCQKVENEFIGVNCGIMDQFAVANCIKNNVLFLNCNTLELEQVPFDLDDYNIVIMNTNKPRSLIKSAYNERKASCDESLKILQQSKPMEFLADAAMEDLSLLKDEVLRKRTRHVVSEQLRVLQTKKYLELGDLHTVGRLLTASHHSLQYDYEVSGIELDTLVECAIEQQGCLGARMTGAGFGGCAIALVQEKYVARFSETVSAHYLKTTGLHCSMYISESSDGVKSIK